MKQKDKKNYLLKALYEHRFDDSYYAVATILEQVTSVTQTEVFELCKDLENRGLIKMAGHKDGVNATITAVGVEYIEDFIHVFPEEERLTDKEKAQYIILLDELLERIKLLELGQEIIYDDLKAELSEVKQILEILNKKNIKQLLLGKLVDVGLGEISEKIVNEITGLGLKELG